MEKKREVPKKNYYLLALLLICTVALVCFLANWYLVDQQTKYTGVITSVLSEVKEDELSSYLVDNTNVIIYFASSKDAGLKGFEEEFKNYINKEELKDQIIYVDTSTITDSSFYKKIEEKYFDASLKKKKITLSYIPNLTIFRDGKVKSIMVTYDDEINLDMVKEYFQKNGVIEK